MIDNEFTTESKVEKTPTVNITVGEMSGVSVGTRVVVNHNTSDPNQHTIGAITGLDNRLEEIEKLKPVYSNMVGVANYYKCVNGPYDGDGYFVSLASPDTVKKCNGNNNEAIFGVTVSEAAFVGRQADGTTVSPLIDSESVLVATTGLVRVRCTSDVSVGDYVVANADGIARKTEPSGTVYQIEQYGYRVVAVHQNLNNDNIDYASIMLGVQADVTDKISASVNHLDSRLRVAETGITSAINLAHQAMDEIEKIDTSKLVTSDRIEAIEGTVNDAVSKVDGALSNATNASIMASRAEATANNAVVAAENMKNGIIEDAHKALTETRELRDELDITAQIMKDDVSKATLGLHDLSEELKPLATWNDGKGVAGFVARADADAVTLASVTKLEGDFGTSLAGFVSKTTAENAEIQALASYNGNAAGLIADVKDTKAEIELIAKGEGAISGLKNIVDETKAQTDVIAQKVSSKYETIDSWELAAKETDVVYYAKDAKTYHYFENNIWKDTTDPATAGLAVALAGVRVQSDENSSSINNFASWQGKTKDTLARLEQKADENGAYIQSTVINMDKYAVGPHSQVYGFTLEQAADILKEGIMYAPIEDMTEENGKAETYKFATKAIELVETKDASKVYYEETVNSDGEIVITYHYYAYDKNQKKYTWMTSPTLPTYTQEFYKWFIYRWSEIEGGVYRWIAVDKDYKETEINASNYTVYFTEDKQETVDTTHGYWYKTGIFKDKDGNVLEAEYEPYVLYKWMKYETKDADGVDVTKYEWTPVATLAGNSKNRVVSMIKQEADRIESAIATIDGKYAGTKAFIDDNQSVLQDVVSWRGENGESLATFAANAGDSFASASQIASVVDEDGNITEASIVAIVNDNKSQIYLDADNIMIDGVASFRGKVEEIESNYVSESYIEYALSSSSDSFVAVEGDSGKWSTKAPEQTDGTYLWQRITVKKASGEMLQTTPTYMSIAKGNDGATPKLLSEWKEFAVSDSDEVAPTNGWDTVVTNYDKSAGMTYIWTRTAQSWDTNGDGKQDGDAFYSEAFLDNSATSISAWCKENNQTFIDGASIYTGTIDTLQLAAEAITADKIAAEAITSRNYYTKDDNGEYTTTKSGKGMKLNLTDGTWDSQNFKVASDGSVNCSNITIKDGVIKSSNYAEKEIPTDETFEEEIAISSRVSSLKESESITQNGTTVYKYDFTFNGGITFGDKIVQRITLVDNKVEYQNKMESTTTWKEGLSVDFTDFTNGNYKLTFTSNGYEKKTSNVFVNVKFTIRVSGVRATYMCDAGAMISFRDDAPEIKFPLFSVNPDGRIISKSGQIGGYILDNDILTSGSGNTTVKLDASEDNDYAFSAGSEVSGIAPFSVTKNGVLNSIGGTFIGNVAVNKCSIGPIVFNNRGFNLSQINIRFYGFANGNISLSILARDENRLTGYKGQVNYNYYNETTDWITDSKSFTTGGTLWVGPTSAISPGNASKVIYTKPHIAWTLSELKGQGIDIANLLQTGNWEERSFEDLEPSVTADELELRLHMGGAVIFADSNNTLIHMFHFPLMRDYFGDISENIITASDRNASIVCGGGTFNSNVQPGFYLGVDGFRLGNTTGSDFLVESDGSVWCKEIYVKNQDGMSGYVELLTKIKDLETRIAALEKK